MTYPFRFDGAVGVECAVYLAWESQKKRQGDPVSRLPLLKMMYHADKLHLKNSGKLIYGDRYYALKLGPVPSLMYSVIIAVGKNQRLRERDLYAHPPGASQIYLDKFMRKAANALRAQPDDPWHVVALREPNHSEISRMAKRHLDDAVEKHAQKSANQLIREFHKDPSYKKAWEENRKDGMEMEEMKIDLIASNELAGPQYEKLIEYFRHSHEVSGLLKSA